MKDFTGKVAVVSGGASGIGRAMAQRFLAAGMKVVIADVEEAALRGAELALGEKGGAVLGVVTDVARAEEVEALARRTLDAFGAVHILCNNAGVASDFAPVWDQTLENWQWVLGVNLWGVIHGIRAFVPTMLKQGGEAHIVNTASMAGLMSVPWFSAYHVSKHAVVTLSESLHYELELSGARVKVSVLCPGFVNTRIMESDRNRPRALQTPDRRPSETAKAWLEAYREWVAAGMAPGEVAERVFEAIREERFYVFPHPEWLEYARLRMETVLRQANPALSLPDDMKRRLHL